MTQETEEIKTQVEPSSALSTQLAGTLALGLIFFATGSITWVYLQDASAQTAAVVEAAVPPPRPLDDPHAFDDLQLSAKSAIVVDITDGRTLFALHPDSQWPLASLTKVPLALIVADVIDPSTTVTIPFSTGYNSHATGDMREGDRWRLQDVIDFTLAVSSNTGANILGQIAAPAIQKAYPLAPPEGTSVWRMNDLARSLGLDRTYFLNNNGLDVSRAQSGAYGSARDVATLFAYAASTSPELFAATRKHKFTLKSIDGNTTTAVNTDEALPDLPDIVLGKTGFTELAQGNLAVVFEEGDHLLSIVVLGSTYSGRFDDIKRLTAAAQKALGAVQ